MLRRFMAGGMLAAFLLVPVLRGQNAGAVRGKVVDAVTGEAVVGATVMFSPAGKGAATDNMGMFQLAPMAGADSLIVRCLGYQSLSVPQAAVPQDVALELWPATYLHREVTVTAKRHAASPADLSAPVESIDAHDARWSTAQTAGEIIAQAQSLFVKDYGGLSGIKTVTLRGASEGQVLVLEDGFRLNNPQGGWVDFNMLPLFAVAKVEVVRGGASAQYGSEAVGGIVHLRTLPPPEHFAPQAAYVAGNHGTGGVHVSAGQRFGRFATIARAGLLRTAGDYPIPGRSHAKLQNNGLQREDFYWRGDYAFSRSLQLRALHKDSHSDRQVAGSLLFPSPEARQVDDSRLSAVSLAARSGRVLDLTVQACTQRAVQEFTNPDPLFPVASRHRVDSRQLIAHNRSRTSAWDLLYGFELAHHAVSSTDINQPRRDQRSAFVQAEWRWSKVQRSALQSLAVLPALRVDAYSDAGTHASPKLGVVWKWEKQVSASWHASAGRSFRVPSMNDLFWPAGPFVAGNPNLRPEIGQQYDGGVLLQWPDRWGEWKLAMDLFHSRMRNLILWVPNEDYRFMPQNLAHATVRGWEPTLAWQSRNGRFAAHLSYTRLQTRDEGNDPATRGRKLIHRPESKLDAAVTVRLASVTLGASQQYVGERFARQDNSLGLPGYRLTHFYGSCSVTLPEGFHAELSGTIANLFDKHLQIMEGYPTPGREYRLAFTVGR